MTKSKIFFYSSLSYLVGILISSFFNLTEIIWLEITVSLLILWIIIYLFRKKWALIVLFVFSLGILGVIQIQFILNKIENQSSVLTNLYKRGLIIRDPEKKNNQQKIVVLIKSRNNQERILIKTNVYSNLNYGDEIKFNCQPKVPSNFSTDFNYKMWLAKEKIYYTCSDNKLKVIKSDQGNKVYTFILKIKNKLEKTINQIIPQPEAALANGLLLGGSNRMPKELKVKFSQTGMSHIVAVSGFNVTVIATYLIFLGIMLGLKRQQAFWLALLGIILFVILIGWPASAVRAGVMASLLLWAIKNGRLANAINAILLAGVIMLAFNPLLLRWDVGFQLSFLAALGLILLTPFWEKYFIKKYRLLGLTEIFFLTLSAQIFVIPIILVNFHSFSPISLLANLLILGILPLTMTLVFLTAISGIIFHPLGLILGWISYWLLHYILNVINFLAQQAWQIKLNHWNNLFVVVWYGMIFLVYQVFIKRVINLDKIKKEKII